MIIGVVILARELTYITNPNMKWSKIIRFVGLILVLGLSGSLLYLLISSSGRVVEKAFLSFLVILITLVLTADFHDDVIGWFKNFSAK